MVWALGHASRPFKQLPPCGDGWVCLSLSGRVRVMLADGIGHGAKAHRIVNLSAEHLDWISHRAAEPLSLGESMDSLHNMLLGQGADCQAAVALVDLESTQNAVAVASVGNVEVLYVGSDTCQGLPSMRGMVGGIYPRSLKVSHLKMDDWSLLCLVSDGVDSAQTREYLQRLRQRHNGRHLQLEQEARLIVEHFGRLSDDASCVLIQALSAETS